MITSPYYSMLSIHLTLVTVLKLLQQYLNLFTPTRRKIVSYFCQFLTVLEYSGMKFPRLPHRATTRYLYVVCIYGESFLCSNGLWCDTSRKYCRYIVLICSKFILQTTETYIYKCRSNASFRVCLLYISTIFIEVMHTIRYLMVQSME
jgi:hypothetical protein